MPLKNIRSTKNKNKPITVKLKGGEEYTIPLKKHNYIYASVKDAKKTMYTDQNGAFPTRSSKENIYVMILCAKDNNVILS